MANLINYFNMGIENSSEIDNDTLLLPNDMLEDFTSIMSAIKRKTPDSFEFLVRGVLLLCVSLFGLMGNTVTIVMLSMSGMRGSFSTLLRGLALFDILYLAMGIVLYALPAISITYQDNNVYNSITPACFGFGHIGRVGSVFVTLSVTVERYFAIVHPLRYFWQKKYLLLSSATAAVLFNVPKFFELETKVLTTNMTLVTATSLRTNDIYVTYYVFWAKLILIEVIPYFSIIVLNWFIFSSIRRAKRFRNDFEEIELDALIYQQQQRIEMNLAAMLISISLLFIFCQSFKIIPDIYEVFVISGTKLKQNSVTEAPYGIRILVGLTPLMLAVNSSANFILYTFRGKKFRKTLLATLCPQQQQRQQQRQQQQQQQQQQQSAPEAASLVMAPLVTSMPVEASVTAMLSSDQIETEEHNV